MALGASNAPNVAFGAWNQGRTRSVSAEGGGGGKGGAPKATFGRMNHGQNESKGPLLSLYARA
ncbi:hypothetical protein GCM10023192_71040 [Amycolatopsis samaneae]